jgi:hypothetical protein
MESNFGIEMNNGGSVGFLGSPRYGIFNPYRQSDAMKELIKSSNLYLSADKADGQPFVKLEPRTLNNGVSNGEYTPQNVSVDVVLQASDVTGMITSRVNLDYAIVTKPNDSYMFGKTDVTTNGSAQIGDFGFINVSGNLDLISNVGKVVLWASTSTYWVGVTKGTTLEQARTLLAGTVIRYQLAVPIDTLNVPFKNPMIDQVGDADCTLVNFAGTSADGYTVDTAPNGKSVTGLKGDGLDSRGDFGSNAPNPVGGNFAFASVFKTGGIQAFQYLYSGGNPNALSIPYLGIQFLDTGRIRTYCGTGNLDTSLFVATNTFYKIVFRRKNGILDVLVNGVNVLSVANSATIPSDMLTRIFARINSVSGTAHSNFFNGTLFELGYADTDVDKFEANFNKVCASKYGL